jgi:hypothetical protein
VLVLDVYTTHRTDKIQQLAENLDIELLYVPSGGTGEYQLLDRLVFGELKSRARAEFARKSTAERFVDFDNESTLQVLVQCWNKISVDNVVKAWHIE